MKLQLEFEAIFPSMCQSSKLTFKDCSFAQLDLLRWCMGPEVDVCQHKQPTIPPIVLAGDLSSLARYCCWAEVMCGVRVSGSPACWHRGFACLLHLALPLTVEVRANGFANCAQAVTATCKKAAAQCYACVILSRVLLPYAIETQATTDTIFYYRILLPTSRMIMLSYVKYLLW